MKRISPLVLTGAIWILSVVIFSLFFKGFASPRSLLNLLNDGAFLGVIAIGISLVILTGGIDLSVGSLAAMTGISLAVLITKYGWNPLVASALVLLVGALLGVAHGVLITQFKIASFLVTLGGLFLYRGIALTISKESIVIENEQFSGWSSAAIGLPFRASLSYSALVFLLVLAIVIFIERQTRWGRSLRAIGGSEQASLLMGLPVNKSLVSVYAVSGFCAALGGVLFALYTSSGSAISGAGLELDAIACVVIGGASLAGGYGSVIGTFLGVLLLGTIQVAIIFQGSLSSWWTKIIVGGLILAFVLIRRALDRQVR